MSEHHSVLLGIEIGGSKLQIVAGDAQGNVQRRWRQTADRTHGAAGIREQLEAGLRETSRGLRPQAIRVGFGGPVDWRTGRIARSHQVDGWEGFPLRQWLAELSELEVLVENDSNSAAYAEATCGAAAGHSPSFYFNLGSGVGGGLILDGRIYHGAPPGKAEFGHLRLDQSSGIVESRCSGWAVDRRIRELVREQSGSVLSRLIGESEGGEARHLPEALSQGDAVAARILDELASNVALALSHVIHLIHPSIVVLGGGLAMIGQPLRDAIAAQLPRFVMDAFAPGPPLVLAKLGEDAVPVGALLLCRSVAAL